MLNKKINDRKSNIWFKDHNIVVEVDEANHESYDSDDEVERNTCLKDMISKFFDVIQITLVLKLIYF